MENQVENKKVLKAVSLELEHVTGISTKSGKPYDIIVGQVELTNGAKVKVNIEQNLASYLFNIN